MNQVWTGPVSDFVPTKVIYNGVLDDTEGYVGYLPSNHSIYVVFRGSESIANWMTNLSTAKTKWTSHPECTNCQVHAGFYGSEQDVFPNVLTEVNRLRALFPTYSVKTTGHSLGAALAYLTQLDLIK